MQSLRALWDDANALRGVRCIVITGAGEGFCAGADMSLLASDRADAAPSAEEELSFLPGLRVACPVIAAVNGACAGGGLHFVADADIALASEDAVFVDPHVTVGQVSALEPLTLLPRASASAVLRMALLGSAERLSAKQALDAGLISEVVAPSQLLERALELAEAIGRNSPAAVSETRRIVRAHQEELLRPALEAGWETIKRHWSHPDCAEGPAAFTERRSPRWIES
jgi:enoyl-CoA hydratase/carnithine racemase